MKLRPLAISALILLLAAAAVWWRFGRGPEVAAVAAARGTAVEIVYATGGVEPVHWSKVASLIRERIVEICDLRRQVGEERRRAGAARRQRGESAAAGAESARRFPQARNVARELLITSGAATTQAYERASMDLNQVQAQVLVQIVKINDDTIVAPMDGVVLRRDGELGEIAEVNQILYRVGVPRPLQVVAG